MSTQRRLNAVPVLPASSTNHVRHQSHCLCIKTALRSQKKRHLFHTSSCLSPSSQAGSTLSSATSTHQPSLLLQEIIKLCHFVSLTKALALLRMLCGNAYSTSLQTKEAIRVLLEACGNRNDIETGRRVHEIVSGSTQFCNDSVINARLVTMYAACGCPLDSRFVFDNLKEKNLYQWNTLISGLVRNRVYGDAVRLFVEMVSTTELKPDNFTLPCVIKACGGILDARMGEVVHGMATKTSLVLDVFVGNALIAMYGKCGFVEKSLKVFNFMPERNLVSWNSMICAYSENGDFKETFRCFKEMFVADGGLLPDIATLVTMLSVCAGEAEIDMGMMVHCLAVKLELSEELTVSNALVDMYSKCACLTEAKLLFDKNNNKNVVSWNTLIGGFSRDGDVYGTYNLLQKMQMQGGKVKTNEVTILNVLPVCSEKSQLLRLKEIHGYSYRHEFQCMELVGNALVAAYAKCGMLSYAEVVFNCILNKTVSSWNAILGGYIQSGNPEKVLDLYLQLTYSGLKPNCFTISSLLLACVHLKSLNHGREIHGFVQRNGLETDQFIVTSLLSLYIHCMKSSAARVLFDGVEYKSLVTWNAMISGYSQNGLPDEALFLFHKMMSAGIQPDGISIASILGACSQLSALKLGKETHCYALKALLMEDICVGCSIIDMYAKSGSIKEARKIFDGLKDKGVASWNAIIAGYGFHGYGKEAIRLFQKMKSIGKIPDAVTFMGILIACSHAGLVEEGLEYFKKMQHFHKIKPNLEHYACLIDMLGRAGRLEEALSLVDKMPEEPDARIWSSLLRSCRTFGAAEIGESIAEKLIELEPRRAENYVLLSNLYAGSGRWDDVRRVRQLMKEIGLQKEAGWSWIELEGKVHSFTAGENFLPGLLEIH